MGDVIAVPANSFHDQKWREGDRMRFSDHDLTLHVMTELSGKRKSEGGTSLPDRVEETTRVVIHIATLATDGNTWMRREEMHRVKPQWGRPFE